MAIANILTERECFFGQKEGKKKTSKRCVRFEGVQKFAGEHHILYLAGSQLQDEVSRRGMCAVGLVCVEHTWAPPGLAGGNEGLQAAERNGSC